MRAWYGGEAVAIDLIRWTTDQSSGSSRYETWSGEVTRNVFWQSMTGLKIGGDARVIYNAVFGATSRPGGLLMDGAELTASDTGIDFMDCGRRLVVMGNTVPGAQSVCIQAGAGWCLPERNFRNNTGHSCLVGFATKGGVTRQIQDMTLWQIRHIGIWGYAHGSPTIRNVRLADFSVGMLWGAIGPDSATHIVQLQTVALVDSLMVGRTRSNPFCRDQVGILLGTMAGQGPSISPSTCGPLGGHWTRGIYGMEHRAPSGIQPVSARREREGG